MIRADLRRARAWWIRETHDRDRRRERRQSDFLAVVDHGGNVVDFHALRKTYVTLLIKGGATVKVAQELSRHSDPKLTMNVYTKLGLNDLAGALDGLPSVSGSTDDAQAIRATGTDDVGWAQYGAQRQRDTAQRGAATTARRLRRRIIVNPCK
jgi:hypothetical protein